ncbi:MAG: hypothetical protein JXR83_13350 [Deltaproteobacteria bacterium]|nr:hypothetical protein [Deltaproteobacteria bacterium]
MTRLARHPWTRAAAALWGLALVACCAETAVIVELAPDPAIAPAAAIAPRLATLQLLLDAEGGFAGVEGTGSEVAGFKIADPDGDGALELLLEVDVAGRVDLPLIRIDAGNNADRSIAIAARGFDAGGSLIASGSIAARALFSAGRVAHVKVPFDLVLALRPRVVAVTPTAIPDHHVVEAVSFHVSRPLDPDTLVGQVALIAVDLFNSETNVPVEVRRRGACALGTEQWDVIPTSCGATFFRPMLTLGSAITDRTGARLVDSSGKPGFSHQLTISQVALGEQCQVTTSCASLGIIPGPEVASIDAYCIRTTGRFEPAPCSVAASGCLGQDLVWSPAIAADNAECQELRDDSSWVDGACVVEQAWPCTDNSDCTPLGTQSQCSGTPGYCEPPDCSGAASCPGKEQRCTNGECLPRVGTCALDCTPPKVCPSSDQRCEQDQNGAYVCR